MRGRTLRLDPADPREGRLQLGRRLRRARPRARHRRLRALRAQAPAPVRARRGRRGRGRARRTCTRSSARSRRRPSSASARSTASCSPAPPTAPRRASAGRSARPTAASSCPPCWCVRAQPDAAAAGRQRAAPAARCTSPSACRSRAGLGGARRVRRARRRDQRAGRCWPGSRSPPPASAGPPSGCARAKKRLPLVLPLDAAARAVADAYRELGELSTEAAASLTIEPRAAGYLRCELAQATPDGGPAVRRRAGRARQRLRQRRATSSRARSPTRAAARSACSAACSRASRRSTSACIPCPPTSRATRSAPRPSRAPGAGTSGPGRLVFTQRTDEGREARAEAASADGGYETLVRDVWVLSASASWAASSRSWAAR